MNPIVDIGILNYPQAQAAAILGLKDLFLTANNLASDPSNPEFRVSEWHIPAVGSPVELTASSGDTPQGLTCFILPPRLATESGDNVTPAISEWIHGHHNRGAVACSVCAGAFHLAEAGLFMGRTVTTHWALGEQLATSFPDCLVDTDRMVIEDGDLITAGGVMAWTDLGLRLINRFAGPTLMLAVSRFFLVDPSGREQSFYSAFAPRLDHGDKAILASQRWLQTHFAEELSIRRLASKAALTERTFLRRFQRATSLNPTAYIQLLRIGKARELLETTVLSFNEVAWQVGYSDPAALRKIFRRQIGLNPAEYRRRFRPWGQPE